MNAAAKRPAAGCGTARAHPVARELPEMVDVVFDLLGESLPAGYEWPLFRAIARAAPWIADVPQAGVHPVRGNRVPEGGLLLARRAKLVVRMPRDRVCAASVLEQTVLDLGGASVKLGQGTFRKLAPAPTLFSARVTTGEADEIRFLETVEESMAALGVEGQVICGRRLTVQLAEGPASAFGVAVHGLGEAHSLRLQAAGLGIGHEVGCGLLVPHKTIVAAA